MKTIFYPPNISLQNLFVPQVDIYCGETGSLLHTSVSSPICDTGSKDHGLMDFVEAGPLSGLNIWILCNAIGENHTRGENRVPICDFNLSAELNTNGL